MPTTSGNLYTAVAAFMHRPTTVFTVDGWDVLLQAMNNARLQTERLIDFELSRVFCQLTNISITSGGSLSNAKLFGTSTAVDVKKIKSAFLGFSDGSGQFPIDIIHRDKWIERQKRRYANSTPVDKLSDVAVSGPLQLVQVGETVYITPANSEALGGTTVSIYFDAFKYLPAYTSGLAETDFLLTRCFDWLLYSSIMELNHFLKEDERVVLNDRLVSRAWDAVVNWNANYITQETDVSLD